MLSRAARALPDSWFVKAIAYAQLRFEPELKHAVALCPSGGVALDVGAWYGPWTYWLARRAARVLAFEPNPEVADVLERTVATNVTLFRCAASDRAGHAALSVPPGGRGTEGRASLGRIEAPARVLDVPLCRIDDLVPVKVDFMKIDVEGHEHQALRGAQGTIERSHPVLVIELEERHAPVAPTLSLLTDWGYHGRVLDAGRWVPLGDFDFSRQEPPASYLSGVFGHRYVSNVLFT